MLIYLSKVVLGNPPKNGIFKKQANSGLRQHHLWTSCSRSLLAVPCTSNTTSAPYPIFTTVKAVILLKPKSDLIPPFAEICSGLTFHLLKVKILTMPPSPFTPISIAPATLTFLLFPLPTRYDPFPSALSTVDCNEKQTMIIVCISTMSVDKWQKSSSDKKGNLSWYNLEALWVS